jgi:hypothetical protein
MAWSPEMSAKQSMATQGCRIVKAVCRCHRKRFDAPIYGAIRHIFCWLLTSIAMTKATLVLRSRTAFHHGVVEMVVWAVEEPVPPSWHRFKCRWVFVRHGQRLVGYDNEGGKGDHKHLGSRQMDCKFVDIDTFINDFLRHVEMQA